MRVLVVLILTMLVSSCAKLPGSEEELNTLVEDSIHIGMNVDEAKAVLSSLGFRNLEVYDPKLLYPNAPLIDGRDYRVILSGRRDYIPCGFTRHALVRLEDGNVAKREGFIGRTCL